MTNDELAAKLRSIRNELGASTAQVADWSGIGIERLEEIELSGHPSMYEFERICLGLGLDSSQVLQNSVPDLRRSAAWFRSETGQLLDPADLRLLRAVAELGEQLYYLQGRLGESSSVRSFRQIIPLDQNADYPWKHGYQLGEKARAKFEKPAEPIPDMAGLLSRYGVYILIAEFSSPRIEAASLWHSEGVPTILLNRKAGQVRYAPARRAIIAHELCHLLHDGGESEAMARITFEEGRGNYEQRVEQRARAFAPAFLAPPKKVKDWWRHQSKAPEIKNRIISFAKYWGLSFEGALWHAKNCGQIAEDLAQEIRKDKLPPEAAIEVPQERSLPPEGAIRYLVQDWATGLVDRAWQAGVITEGRRGELLAWR